ncbi:hypothetical protein DFH08DRAFT_224383 [Mycena albidolilacea]|uniref:Cytochrome P450 n=1 Tax=Mycena albidolilacea TaxID=1033008 RepID=A0AAD7EPK9_9AGAR|nr:hypothetical protein DFH08DRAFT_224383 [Mycena albidolilacea]
MSALTLVQITACCAYATFTFLVWTLRSRPFPPGPGQFLIGNPKDLPKGGHEWVKHRNLARQYKDPVFFRVLGKPVMSANDLLEDKEMLHICIFNIFKARDENGDEYEQSVTWSSGLVSPFFVYSFCQTASGTRSCVVIDRSFKR